MSHPPSGSASLRPSTILLALAALAAPLVGCGAEAGGSGDLPDTRGLVALTIDPVRSEVGLGGTERFRVMGEYQDGTQGDVTAAVTWAVGEGAGIASVDATGLATGLALGTATLVATEPRSGLTAAAFLEVARFGREGRADEPVLLDLESPRAGQVNSGVSHYAVEVTPGRHYYVFLTEPTGEVDLRVNDDAQGLVRLCEAGHSSWPQQACVTRPAPSTDRLHIEVDGRWTNTFFGGEGGADYVLEVVPGWIEEGSAEAPLLLAEGVDHAGTVGIGQSVYQVLTDARADYAISVTGLSADADLEVSGEAGLWSVRCSAQTEGTADEHCEVRADGGRLYLQVYGRKTRVGTPYRVRVDRLAPPVTSEGTTTPVGLEPGTTWEGQVAAGYSYYTATVTAGRSYRVRVEEDDPGSVWMYVSDVDDTFASWDCAKGSYNDGTAECLMAPVATDRLYIQLKQSSTELGVRYRLTVEEVVYAAEGAATPLLLDAPVDHPGQVDDGQSRYEVPAVLDALYAVTLSEPLNAMDLTVAEDAEVGTTLCEAQVQAAAEGLCLFRTPVDPFFVQVDGSPGVHGGTYTLGVHRAYESEGADAAPLARSLGASWWGQVEGKVLCSEPGDGCQNSYYTLPVTPLEAVRVTVSGTTDEVYWRVSDPSGSAYACAEWGDAVCDLVPAGDTLRLQFQGVSTDFGAGYDVLFEAVP